MTDPAHLPRIAVIGCGGTISSLGSSSLDVLDYPEFGQKLDIEAILERVPEARRVAEPIGVRFRNVGSTAIGPTEWAELRVLIHGIVALCIESVEPQDQSRPGNVPYHA